MNDINQKEIFSKNLNRLISNSGKSQKELADDLGISPQTLNTWTQAVAYPRMGKIQMLADYFGVDKSELIDEHKPYYLNDETAQLAQELLERTDLKILMSTARNASPETVTAATSVIEALEKKGKDTNDEGC